MPDMPHPSRATAVPTARCLLVVLIVASALAPAMGTAAAAQGDDAQLVVDQPHYIDHDVETRQLNGSTLYVARGSVLELYPQNFATENVVNYGVATPNASLSLNRKTGTFRMDASGTGTYQVFFVVEETTTVEQPAANTTENGTNTTTTTTEEVTEQRRYTARVRVAGGTDLVHRPAGEIEGVQEAAANWRELNGTLEDRGLIGASGIEPTIQEMVNWYELHPSNNPLEALSGNVVVYLILGTTSTAAIVWVVFFGGHAWITRQLRKQLHIFEAVEAEEGTAKEAVVELERQQNKQAVQNMDWQDLPGFDDHVAKASREIFGETLHDGAVNWQSMLLPRHLVRDRLQAMGHDGYVAVVDERSAPDGGADTDAEIASVHLAHEDDDEVLATTDEDIVDLHEADEQTLTAVRDALDSWDEPLLATFELADAEYDAGDLDTTYEAMDLDEVTDAVQADMRHFEDEAAFGEYLLEFLQHLEQSPFCDDEGRPDEIRYALSHWLKQSQLLGDRYNWPMMHYYREAIERALIDYDPEQEARDIIDRIQAGGAA